jgi:pimeloyl-ACP methyl ester carboxylesterase
VAPDLPSDDDSAGFPEYADAAIEAIGDRSEVILVAQSLAGFTAPIVCTRRPVELMILVAAMVPSPGESAGDWWANTGWEQDRRALAARDGRDIDGGIDVWEDFFHDVSPEVVAAAQAHGERAQSGTPMQDPWPLDAWPDVPTRFLLCRDDRFFPADFQRRIVRERLGIVPDEMPGGHLPALSHPDELVDRLERYRRSCLG